MNSFQNCLLLTKGFLFRKPIYHHSAALFARKVIRPNVVKILDNDGRELKDYRISQQSQAVPVSRLPKSDTRYFDEGTFVTEFQGTSKADADTRSIPVYEKASDNNNIFRKLMTQLAIKSRREKMDLIVVEGRRSINDAILSQMKIKYLFFTQESNVKNIVNLDSLVGPGGTKLVKVLYKDMRLFSSLVTSPGLMAVCEKPDYSKPLPLNDEENQMPLSLVCDNIRDPGNLGTLLRTGVAAGASQIILTKGCTDLWNTKVVKSAAGAHFRLPIKSNVLWDELTSLLPEKFDLFIADSKQNDSLENEGNRYFNQSFFEQNDSNHKVLVIGNEAYGLSSESYGLIEEFSGKTIHIPLYNNVESLNSATACSILLYEFRRQFESSVL